MRQKISARRRGKIEAKPPAGTCGQPSRPSVTEKGVNRGLSLLSLFLTGK